MNPPINDMMKMDGYDDCVAGVVIRYGQDPIMCYDKELVIQKLISQGIETEEEAEEFFDFNQLGAWVGDETPCFLVRDDLTS
jgi:hypothetical protein